MRPQAEAVPAGATRWGRRHPRLVAAGVGLIAGTTVAAVMWAISLGFNPAHGGLGILLWLEGTFVPVASIWAFVLFGRYTRRPGRGPWLAMLGGIACVMLTIATLALLDTLSTCWLHRLNCLSSGYFWTNMWDDIHWAMLASLFLLFIPQLMGAVGGGAIWWMTRDRDARSRGVRSA